MLAERISLFDLRTEESEGAATVWTDTHRLCPSKKVPLLRNISFLFLALGLGGFMASAVIANERLERLPRRPEIAAGRYVPHNILGVVVYETEVEHQRLSLLEGSSGWIFFVGLGAGLVYFQRFGMQNALRGGEPSDPDGSV